MAVRPAKFCDPVTTVLQMAKLLRRSESRVVNLEVIPEVLSDQVHW
jgi:hypothetical protein